MAFASTTHLSKPSCSWRGIGAHRTKLETHGWSIALSHAATIDSTMCRTETFGARFFSIRSALSGRELTLATRVSPTATRSSMRTRAISWKTSTRVASVSSTESSLLRLQLPCYHEKTAGLQATRWCANSKFQRIVLISPTIFKSKQLHRSLVIQQNFVLLQSIYLSYSLIQFNQLFLFQLD